MSHFKQLSDHLYVFEDTCNVYVVKDGDAALLIDAASGAVAEHLGEIGCTSVEWILHTHHHRDQCWGSAKLAEGGAKVAVPQYEQHLFDRAELYWQSRRVYDNYNDRNTFFTVGGDIPVAQTLDDYETFEWRGHEFFVLPAKGHTLGSIALLAEIDGTLTAFSGDLMNRGGVLYQLHAMEYVYGDMLGGILTLQSIQALRDCFSGEAVAARTWPAGRRLMLPSHSAPIDDPIADINRLERRLMDLMSLSRGLGVAGRFSIPEPLYLPEPKFVPLSEHLLWGGNWTCSFFYVLLSESGKAMFIDYGHAYIAHMHAGADHEGWDSMRFVEHHLKELKRDYGVTSFDLAVPTHIHDDHTCGMPHLQKHYGTKAYALEQVAQVLADPAAWASTPCCFPRAIRFDKVLGDGDRFDWEEYGFEIHFAPGQTEYHSVVAAEIDGRKVAFTGDNIFYDDVVVSGAVKSRPFQTTVLRNSFQLDMHRRCVDVMRRVNPELICPGHKDVYPCDKRVLDDYADFIARKERVFRNLVAEPADHHIDLFWARLLPYVAGAEPGGELEYELLLRNNLERKAKFEARLLPPNGWRAGSDFVNVTLDAGERTKVSLKAKAPAQVDRTRRLMTAEIRIDGASQGPVAEALVTVNAKGSS